MIVNQTYEQKLLHEIKDLDQKDVEKILRMIHFMKKEILNYSDKTAETANIMAYAGMLSDLSDEEANLFKHITKRRNLFDGREVQL